MKKNKDEYDKACKDFGTIVLDAIEAMEVPMEIIIFVFEDIKHQLLNCVKDPQDEDGGEN